MIEFLTGILFIGIFFLIAKLHIDRFNRTKHGSGAAPLEEPKDPE